MFTATPARTSSSSPSPSSLGSNEPPSSPRISVVTPCRILLSALGLVRSSSSLCVYHGAFGNVLLLFLERAGDGRDGLFASDSAQPVGGRSSNVLFAVLERGDDLFLLSGNARERFLGQGALALGCPEGDLPQARHQARGNRRQRAENFVGVAVNVETHPGLDAHRGRLDLENFLEQSRPLCEVRARRHRPPTENCGARWHQ